MRKKWRPNPRQEFGKQVATEYRLPRLPKDTILSVETLTIKLK